MTDWKPIRDELVKTTLETILDRRNHPLLIIDP
jgi:tyrosine-protein phosphatase SIW14